jgi:DNA repair protein RecO (recombination protein O)
MYNEQRSEGVVLRSTLYKEQDRILSIFTEDHGLMSLMVKKATHHKVLTSPFCQGEFLYVKGKSDLYKFHDGTVLDDHMALRNSFNSLTAAGEIAQAVLHSQMPGKPAPQLYALLTACMKQLPLFEPAFRLTASFRLKLLMHEGLISWEDPSIFPIPLIRSEWEILKECAQARSFQKIREIPVSEELGSKVEKRFKDILL